MSDAAFLYYLVPTKLNASLISRYRSILLSEERQTVDSLILQRSRREKLIARAMLRKVLSHYTGLDPRIWQFRTNLYGRPEIEFPSDYCDLRFSVSHAGGLVACLLCWHREVGLDVEPIRRVDGMLDIADRHFAVSETFSLRALPTHEQHRRFLELWTLKESYLKARGLGLSIPLAEAVFSVTDRPVYATFGQGLPDDPARWQFRLDRLYDHIVALTVERKFRLPAEIVIRDAMNLMNCS